MGRAIEIIKQLEAVTFDWKHNNEHDLGLIAEDVAKVIPEAAGRSEDGQIIGIRVLPIIAMLVEAVKELEKEK